MNKQHHGPIFALVASLVSAGCAHQQPAPSEPAAPAAPPAPAPLELKAAGNLHGYLHKLKCGAPQDARSCKLSPDQERSRLDVVLGGDPAVIYDLRLRVRGVVEPRRYKGGVLPDPANRWFYAGGAPDPSRANNGQAYNIYQLSVSDPKQDYFLNQDTENYLGGGYQPSHTTYKVDYPVVIKVRGQATVSVITDDQAGSGMINNADKTVVDGIPAELLSQPWDGQFFYLEVESITPSAGR